MTECRSQREVLVQINSASPDDLTRLVRSLFVSISVEMSTGKTQTCYLLTESEHLHIIDGLDTTSIPNLPDWSR